MNDKIIYQLVIKDLQVVALEILKRELTHDEIESISKKISDSIDWYDNISIVIRENFK